MKNLNGSVRLFFLLGVLLFLAIYFRSFFMTNFIQPVAIFLWAFWRVISSVDQGIYWGILIVGCLVIIIGLVPGGIEERTEYPYVDPHRSVGRVEYWRALMMDSTFEKDMLETQRESLKKLLISFVAQEQRLEPIDAGRILEAGELPLPPGVHTFLFPEKVKAAGLVGGNTLRLAFPAPKWLGRWLVRYYRPGDAAVIDTTLKWMESVMEMEHGE